MAVGYIYQSVEAPVRNDSVSVGITNVQLMTARSSAQPRIAFVIRNISAAATSIITVVLGNQIATANVGIVLRQYESISDSSETGYTCHQGQINAICADANGSLAIMER